MRGDRPIEVVALGDDDEFTPHARGSTSLLIFWLRLKLVYPACAGIDPVKCAKPDGIRRLPRMRGDRPEDEDGDCAGTEFTPHARGSTEFFSDLSPPNPVYPACAGIDLLPLLR